MENDFSAIILSSGLSERMGQPKALLKWDKSTTFIEKIIDDFMKAGSTKIICMINEKIDPYCRKLAFPAKVEFIVNYYPEHGRFYSIQTGINALEKPHYCFIHNVDNPFVSIPVIKDLFTQRESGKWCSPVYNGKGGHPVLLSNTIITEIANVCDLNTTLQDVLRQYPKVTVETNDDSVLRNINTPWDYQYWFKSLQ